MSIYSKSYTKLNDGYKKISACIESVEYLDQLDCIPHYIESWVNLMDKYSDAIERDRGDKHRSKNCESFCNAGVQMFEDLKLQYQNKMMEFSSAEYEGSFHPMKIKSLEDI